MLERIPRQYLERVMAENGFKIHIFSEKKTDLIKYLIYFIGSKAVQ